MSHWPTLHPFQSTLIWAMLIAASPSHLYTQTDATAINGRITDAESEQPLVGANILLEGTPVGTISDADGLFSIDEALPGTYRLSISMIGYEVFKREIQIPFEASEGLIVRLTPIVLTGQAVMISVNRARSRQTPMAFTDIPHETIRELSTAQDIPMLLQSVPNLNSYSDAGNGIGYSYLKLRGFDQRRTNVSINGISLNDPEDHQVYWVDMPNLIASVADIQVQRGIGSSIYGHNAFGGAINLVTSSFPGERLVSIEGGIGSYGTRTGTLAFNSGLINNSYSFYGRLSSIETDGYRRDAWSKMRSYFLSASRYSEKSTVTLNLYGGPERSHAAWDASPESVLADDHRDNPYSFYADETDNFNQPHFELHHDWRPTTGVSLKQAFYYIRGVGFFEQLKSGADLSYYGIEGTNGDIVRERWVKKNQYGWSPHLTLATGWGEINLGGELNLFDSDHFGLVLSHDGVLNDKPEDNPYYKHNGNKFWVSTYANLLYELGDVWDLTAEVQLQHKQFDFRQHEAGGFSGDLLNGYDLTYTFLHPRIGINGNLTQTVNAFAYVGRASREPADSDLYDLWSGPHDLGVQPLFASVDTISAGSEIDYLDWSDPMTQPEQLTDIELGATYRTSRTRFSVTLYHMLFDNEIIALGGVTSDGDPVTGNADRTVHQGVEIEWQERASAKISMGGNVAFSRNYHDKFEAHNDDGSTGDLSGNPVPLFPSILMNGWARAAMGDFVLMPSVRYVGLQYLDSTDDNDRIVDPYFLLNFNLLWDGPTVGGASTTVKIALQNLLDATYETSGYWYGERYLYPAAGRNVMLSVGVGL